MKTNLAYIDDVMDRAIETEHAAPALLAAERADATKKARKIIGGFRVHDGAAERKALDDMVAKRRAIIEKFRADRTAIRDKLAGLGVTPLAVCPVGAWHKICRDAGLFVLAPDKNGMVGISSKAFDDYNEKQIDKQVGQDWTAYLNRLFPDGRSPASSSLRATLILPDPPADVAEVLCKVQALTLTVAAVGDAIKFAEKPSELAKKSKVNPKDLWAQEQGYEDYADWLKRDPIIFTEHETAAAVIAQFGDFPIEKAAVDAVVASDALLSVKPKAIEELPVTSGLADMAGLYYQQMRREMEAAMYGNVGDDIRRQQQREIEMRQREAMMRAVAAQPRLYDSRNLTGI